MPHLSKLPLLRFRAKRAGDSLETRTGVVVLATAALSAVTWLWCAPVLACQCTALTPRDAYEQANVVFEGRVLELRQPASAEGSAAQRTVWLQVVRAWKGVQAERVEVTVAADRAGCSLDFAAEQSYFVYALEQEGHLSVGSCSRTRTMAEADEDVHVLGMGVTPVDPNVGAADAGKKAPAKQPPARGGCASCTVGATGAASHAHALLFAFFALGKRRTRRLRTRVPEG